MLKKYSFILHPIFFTLYPLLYLYSANAGQASFSQILRSVIVFLGITLALMAVLRLILRDWHSTGLLVSLSMILFFSFGHLVNALRDAKWTGSVWTIVAVWAGIFIIGVGLIIWKGWRARKFTQILNILSAALLVLAGLGWIIASAKNSGQKQIDYLVAPTASQYHAEKDKLPSATVDNNKPDIYYIILDGYAQGEVLSDLYQLDNSPFYEFLRDQGFHIAGSSHSNYIQTILSLGSSLNFAYLDEMVNLYPGTYSREPVDNLLKNSRVPRFLRSLGYQIVTLDSGYEYTNLGNADVLIHSGFSLNAYEQNLLGTTLAMPWVDRILVKLYRAEILSHFQALPDVAKMSGPKFVFVHLVVPHPPFVFARDGGETDITFLGKNDGSHYKESDATYRARYRNQLLYINQKTEEMIQAIVRNSKKPPVILLQSDHGPGSYLDWGSMENTCLRERTSILNALLLPDASVHIPSDLTPVNSFRIVFNTYFGTNLEMRENRTYYSLWDDPYRFMEVTDRVNSCAPLGP
jgi:hypothetical protein